MLYGNRKRLPVLSLGVVYSFFLHVFCLNFFGFIELSIAPPAAGTVSRDASFLNLR